MSAQDGAVRVIRPGPRPYLMIGIPFGLAAAIPIGVFAVHGIWADAAAAAACALVVFAIVCFALARFRIVLTERGIAARETLGRERSVRFDEVVASVPRVLGEPDHPVALDVFTAADQSGGQAPALRIRLKPYRKEDVQRLLAMPALKVTPPAPGSWR